MPQFKTVSPGDCLVCILDCYLWDFVKVISFFFCKIIIISYLTHWEFVRNYLKIWKKHLAQFLSLSLLLSSSLSTNVGLHNNCFLILFPQSLNDYKYWSLCMSRKKHSLFGKWGRDTVWRRRPREKLWVELPKWMSCLNQNQWTSMSQEKIVQYEIQDLVFSTLKITTESG